MPITKVRPAATSVIPIRCIERHVTKQTKWFASQPINMSQIAESYTPPLEHGHLSRIFSGKRYPSIKYARFIADALGMTLQSFLDEIALLHAGELTEGLAQLHANSKITVDGIDA